MKISEFTAAMRRDGDMFMADMIEGTLRVWLTALDEERARNPDLDLKEVGRVYRSMLATSLSTALAGIIRATGNDPANALEWMLYEVSMAIKAMMEAGPQGEGEFARIRSDGTVVKDKMTKVN